MSNGSSRKGVTQTPRTNCYFCGSEGPIETHHIAPQQFDGSDDESNLVDLCPTCHERLERLYDKSFYQELGLEPSDGNGGEVDVIEPSPPEEVVAVKTFIKENTDEVRWPEGVPVEFVIEEIDMSNDEAKDAIEESKQLGEVYEPRTDHLRST